MTRADDEYQLYRELAGWWPLISPKEEYAAEATYLAEVLRQAVADPGVANSREVLDLGSGGGHMAAHLKTAFTLTLVDISGDMLAVSGRLNPECEHIPGDMRTIRLGRGFDAVLVHDAIDYITISDDLRAVAETAFAHCRPGGVAMFVPDHVKDTFREFVGAGGGGDDGSGRTARFREWTWDPDPSDDWVQAEYEFVLREPGGGEQVIREKHRLGAFSVQSWLDLLEAAGFADVAGPDPATAVRSLRAAMSDDRRAPDDRLIPGKPPTHMFCGRRPSGAGPA